MKTPTVPDLKLILGSAILPALAQLPARMSSTRALCMLLAIGLQESGMVDRVQKGNGPAHGLWQFEQGGGVKGVLNHPATAGIAFDLCAWRGVPTTTEAVWQALAVDDILAAGFARLLLFSDVAPLPELDDQLGGWRLYSRVWRPGKPHPERWPANWVAARAEVA